MSDYENIRQLVETRMATFTSLPIAYDNVSFDSSLHDEWCRLTIQDGDAFNAGIGNGCEIRRTGLVVIQLFTSQWSGVKSARSYADELDALFSNVHDGSLQFFATSVNRVGHFDDVYQVNVTIPFLYNGG